MNTILRKRIGAHIPIINLICIAMNDKYRNIDNARDELLSLDNDLYTIVYLNVYL